MIKILVFIESSLIKFYILIVLKLSYIVVSLQYSVREIFGAKVRNQKCYKADFVRLGHIFCHGCW